MQWVIQKFGAERLPLKTWRDIIILQCLYNVENMFSRKRGPGFQGVRISHRPAAFTLKRLQHCCLSFCAFVVRVSFTSLSFYFWSTQLRKRNSAHNLLVEAGVVVEALFESLEYIPVKFGRNVENYSWKQRRIKIVQLTCFLEGAEGDQFVRQTGTLTEVQNQFYTSGLNRRRTDRTQRVTSQRKQVAGR